MGLRWRINGTLLCEAKSLSQPQDTYINDRLHYHLSRELKVVAPNSDEIKSGLWHWLLPESVEKKAKLTKAKFNFNQVIKSPTSTDDYPEGAHTDGEEIELLFDLAPPSGFVDSLYDWWAEKGFLTKAQFTELEKIAER